MARRLRMAPGVSDRRSAGEHVTEHIRLVRELGRGAMGSVWVADHLTLETHVAVKFINRQLLDAGDDEDMRQRFSREARSAAHIKSPHVVQIFDHGVMDDGAPYIIMELLEGESLAQRIEVGPLSLEDSARVVVQVARGLAVAHERGIVHRDIKPENIFLCDEEDGFVCKLLSRNGVVVLAAAISPYRAARDEVRREIGRFVEVFVTCPLETLVQRDVKGLYARALRGEIENFTGVSDPYEPPLAPEIVLDTIGHGADENARTILAYLEVAAAALSVAAPGSGSRASGPPPARP